MLAPDAGAQNANDKAAAEALFDQGKALMVAGNYAAACPKFSESLRLDVGVGTSLWLAECFERSGKIASAWAQFRESAATAVKLGDPREKIAREHASLLEPKLPKLVITVPKNVAAPSLKVLRDGEEVGPALWGAPVPIDPGDHGIVVSAQGKKTYTTTAHIAAAASTSSVTIPALEDDPDAVAVPLSTEPSPEGSTSPRAETPLTRGQPDPKLRLVGVSVAAVGLAGLVIGTVFGFEAMSQLDDSNSPTDGGCNSTTNICSHPAGKTERASAQTDATVSTVGFALGGALVVGGGLLYFFAPKVTHKSTSATVVPLAGPGGGGLAVVGAW